MTDPSLSGQVIFLSLSLKSVILPCAHHDLITPALVHPIIFYHASKGLGLINWYMLLLGPFFLKFYLPAKAGLVPSEGPKGNKLMNCICASKGIYDTFNFLITGYN